MLTIQSGITQSMSRPAFGNFEQKKSQPKDINAYEADYLEKRALVEGTQKEIKELVQGLEDDLPPAAKKGLEVFGVLASTIVGGMATGWGLRKSIDVFGRAIKSSAGQKMIAELGKGKDIVLGYVNKGKNITIEKGRVLGAKIKDSNAYAKAADRTTKLTGKIADSKFGQKVSELAGKLSKYKVVKQAKDFLASAGEYANKQVANLKNKVASIKGSQVTNVAVGTVGVCSGIASGVATAKGTQVG